MCQILILSKTSIEKVGRKTLCLMTFKHNGNIQCLLNFKKHMKTIELHIKKQ